MPLSCAESVSREADPPQVPSLQEPGSWRPASKTVRDKFITFIRRTVSCGHSPKGPRQHLIFIPSSRRPGEKVRAPPSAGRAVRRTPHSAQSPRVLLGLTVPRPELLGFWSSGAGQSGNHCRAWLPHLSTLCWCDILHRKSAKRHPNSCIIYQLVSQKRCLHPEPQRRRGHGWPHL